jgi:hypothetical protein
MKDNITGAVNIGNNNVHTLLVGGMRLLRIILKLNFKKSVRLSGFNCPEIRSIMTILNVVIHSSISVS